MYAVTDLGRRVVWEGRQDPPGATRDAPAFAMWMVAWVGARAPHFTVDDLRAHADAILTFPDQPEETLAAGQYLKTYTVYTLMKAMEKGWVM